MALPAGSQTTILPPTAPQQAHFPHCFQLTSDFLGAEKGCLSRRRNPGFEMTPAPQVFRRQELIQKPREGRREGGEKEESRGGRAVLGAQQNAEALIPGGFQLDLAVPGHPACPAPTGPKRRGSSAKTPSTCLQLQTGCVSPAGRPAGAGAEAPLTWHTKAPHTSGGRRHSQVRGPGHARQWEIPAAPEPQTYPPQAAFSRPPAAPGAPRRLGPGVGGPRAGEGGSWWRRGRQSPLPGREGPRAPRRCTPGARRRVPVPGRPTGSAALPESLYVNEAPLAAAALAALGRGAGGAGGLEGSTLHSNKAEG